MEIEYLHIGERIKDLMRMKGFSQKAIADKLCVNHQRISAVLKQKSVTTDFLQQFMHATESTAAEIFKEAPSDAGEYLSIYRQLSEAQASVIKLQKEVMDLRG